MEFKVGDRVYAVYVARSGKIIVERERIYRLYPYDEIPGILTESFHSHAIASLFRTPRKAGAEVERLLKEGEKS